MRGKRKKSMTSIKDKLLEPDNIALYFISTKLSKNLHKKICNEVVTIIYFALSEKLMEIVRINLSQGISDELYEEKKQIN
jgi:NADPH-dependent 7-cyano-7-deazaguanine reductase QueF